MPSTTANFPYQHTDYDPTQHQANDTEQPNRLHDYSPLSDTERKDYVMKTNLCNLLKTNFHATGRGLVPWRARLATSPNNNTQHADIRPLHIACEICREIKIFSNNEISVPLNNVHEEEAAASSLVSHMQS